MPDADDKCPNQAGVIEQMGCPAPALPAPPAPEPVAVLEKGEIKIRERIEFAVNKDSILPGSTPVLEAVQEVLKLHPEIKVLRVEGHTDSRGGEARNMELSRKRAVSVTKWLVDHGVERVAAGIRGLRAATTARAEHHGRQPSQESTSRVPSGRPGARDRSGCFEVQSSSCTLTLRPFSQSPWLAVRPPA